MRYRKLLINIVVLCLVMLVRRSIGDVQRLDTGYLYPVGHKGNDHVKDLKCAFWFSGKVHIQLTKLLLQMDGLVPSTLNTIFDFQKNTHIHLAVLYNLKTERIGALWLVHLYVNRVVSYYEYLIDEFNDSNNIIIKKISIIHDYIVEKLESETVEHCPERNRFDWTKKQFTGKKPTKVDVRALIEQNTKEMYEMLENNNFTALANMADFKVSNILLLNNEVWEIFYSTIFDNLGIFNIGLGWTNTKPLFTQTWRNTRDLDFASNNLQPIKSYFAMVFSILKVIVLRKTLKFLTLLRMASSYTLRLEYARKWLFKLKDFSRMFYLENDTHIEFLLGSFRTNNIKKVEYIDCLIENIQDKLVALSVSLSCDVTGPIPSLFGDIQDPENLEDLDEIMKVDNLQIANALNDVLQKQIIKHEFGVTWALLNYINEPKPYELF